MYGQAYKLFSEVITPKKMHDTIRQKDIIEFKYQLQKSLSPQGFHFVFVNSSSEKTWQPKAKIEDNILTLQQEFKKRGFFDVHLYFEKEILATYTFRVTK